jgi:SH3-like domain-containing protein
MAVTTQSFRTAFRHLGRVALIAAAISVLHPTLLSTPNAKASSDLAVTTGSVSGLPVPRFVSLKADRVNVRAGPNKNQDVRWVYTRAGMPVEITAEFENWRRVRDWEGAEGWVYHSLLSGKRTGIVVPRLKKDLVPLYEGDNVKSRIVAELQGGVVGQIKFCNGKWCEFSGKNFEGWIEQDRIWGAYPSEKVD